MFSIVIPTWNNLPFLQLCIRSIQQHSQHEHQIIVHINDGSDGSLAWVRENNLTHTHSPENMGICQATNYAASLAKHNYIVYLNDDMYCCPGWDRALSDTVNRLNTSLFMLSGTMIEPRATHNPCVIVGNYGESHADFAEKKLLTDINTFNKADWFGATWPPTLVHRDWWIKLGGYSSEFSPGMSSDNDLSMKFWHAGCRIFLGVGSSLVYHFQSKSTGKIKKNNGRQQFLNKWGITQSVFDQYYLRRGQPANTLVLSEIEPSLATQWAHWRSAIKKRLT